MVPNLDNVPAPSNISALFTISSDNSGLVTIRPNGQGVTMYTISFGDGSDDSEDLRPGEEVSHVYDEGTYDVTIDAMNINGEVTTQIQELMVSFKAPENLSVNVVPVPGDPFSIEVDATADLETFFEVDFGDSTQVEAFMEGETVRHTYAELGEYILTVVARSGGMASTEFTDTVTISDPLLLPLDFEDTNRTYEFVNFGGATSTVVDNPDMSELNPSSRVGQLNKSAGSEVWAGSFIELGKPIDFSEAQMLRVRTWSPQAGVNVLVKIENASNPDIFAEVQMPNTVANEWETMIFDFSGADLSQEYHRIVIFFDFGNNGTGVDYYFDDIEVTDGGPEINFPLDFEAPELGDYGFVGFGGAGASIINNPDPTTLNQSDRVVEFIKEAGSEVWGGVTNVLDDPIDFTGREYVRMHVWSPKAGADILLKFENLGDPNTFVEVFATTTVANQWEELEFDFTGVNSADLYQRMALFFDFGNSGAGEPYYFDNIRLSDGSPSVVLPLGFERTSFDYTFVEFGGASAQIIDNPDPTAPNTSSRVMEFVKEAGSEVWGGVFTELTSPIDFTGREKIRMKIWSPTAGADILLKLENLADPDTFVEVFATTTVANQWEVIEFDFTGVASDNDYQRMVIFCDFGNSGAGEPYYIDDIQLAE